MFGIRSTLFKRRNFAVCGPLNLNGVRTFTVAYAD
jgi:hypothetical protein